VKGKSFVDVGGLWGTVHEKLSVAHRRGARSVTMIDAIGGESEWWPAFHRRMEEMNIPYTHRVADILNDPIEDTWDVVHSAGVLYHLPFPLEYLLNLKRIAGEHVVLTTAVMPKRVKNRAGEIAIPDGGSLFVPCLTKREKRVLSVHWNAEGRGAVMGGINADREYSVDFYGPWWWLHGEEVIRRMCEICGMEVAAEGSNWKNHTLTLLLEVRQ
jgi:SAM-dependent methyltransferase